MEKRWKSSERLEKHDRSRSTLVALLLVSATLITLDYKGGPDSPIEPVRDVAGEAFGPVETVTADVIRPFAAIPDYFGSRQSLRDDLTALEAENAQLRRTVETSDLDRNRLAEYDGLAKAASDVGHDLIPGHVIAMGSAQSFSRTVTIDAGTRAGVRPDMAVVNNDGLVGRVVRTTSTTATILLVVDQDSVVGGRLGGSMELGFLRGRGDVSDTGQLDLDLLDESVIANVGDVATTWGSEGGAPYVAGIPIGRVVSVYNSPRETSRSAVIEPFVDFTSLDLVGVVAAGDTKSDRELVEAEGGRK